MRVLLVAVAVLAVGCKKSRTEPPAAAKASGSGSASVSGALIDRLHANNVVASIDLTSLDLTNLRSLIPPGLDCVSKLLDAHPRFVIGGPQNLEIYASGFPEAATRACVTELAPMLGLSTREVGGGGLEVSGGAGQRYLLAWNDGILSATDAAAPPSGSLGPVVRERIATVPAGAPIWVAMGPFPDRKVTKTLILIDLASTTLSAEVDGSEAGAAETWVRRFLDGVRSAATKKGMTIPDADVALTTTGLSCKVVLNLGAVLHGR